MKNKVLALDSNIFIYHFEGHSSYLPSTTNIFSLINTKAIGMTSVLSLTEALSYQLPSEVLAKIEDKFRTLPNFTIHEVTSEIAIEAARIRREYGFRLPDAIQLATALSQKADVFITNDKRLKKFTELNVLLLEEF